MDYFLSGHGGMSNGTYKLKCRLVTFCGFGSTLDIPKSWKVFDALAAGNTGSLQAYVDQTYDIGTTVDNMTLYPTKDFTSGIFRVGGGKIALHSLDSGQFTLRDFCSLYRDADTVYWIACLN
ncbi:putative adhesin [Sorangium sp. So ce260]|uniref:putative adhesin n=1 Tax=Sorangium sp. So ce260 TaxID=3133291 RepID=UPI003F60EFBE